MSCDVPLPVKIIWHRVLFSCGNQWVTFNDEENSILSLLENSDWNSQYDYEQIIFINFDLTISLDYRRVEISVSHKYI